MSGAWQVVSAGELIDGVVWWDVSSVFFAEAVSDAYLMNRLSLESGSKCVVVIMLIWKLF